MAEILRMPEVAANAAEAVLQEWRIAKDSSFMTGEVIAIVETEKAVVEVEAEADGVLLHALVEAGAAVEVGAAIAIVGRRGEDIEPLLAEHAGAAAYRPPAAAAYRPPAAVAQRDPVPVDHHTHPATGRIFISPLARRIAADAGIPVESISGSGPNGRIVRRDIEAAIRTAQPAVPTVSKAGYTDIPHSRIRRAIAVRLTESNQTVPHFYLRGTARADRLLALREELNAGGAVRISVNDLIVKAVARAHTLVPAMNVIWTADAVRRFESVDVAVAIATDQGLVTPVLRNVEAMTISSVALAVKDFAARAEAGRLRQHELEGGTITVSSLGMHGTEEFTAIINPPHAAILAVGAARREPVVEEGELSVGTVLRVTLSADHRPVDGVVAAEWKRAFVDLLENPVRILA